MNRFGTLVRAFRERKGLAQREVAEKLGITVSYLSHIERGRRLPRSPWIVYSLSVALDLPLLVLQESARYSASIVPYVQVPLSPTIVAIAVANVYLPRVRVDAIGAHLGLPVPAAMSDSEACIGDCVRRLRQGQGLTQENLADKAGVSRVIVCALERYGTAPRSDLSIDRIARVLGYPPDELRVLAGISRSTETGDDPIVARYKWAIASHILRTDLSDHVLQDVLDIIHYRDLGSSA